MLGYTLMEQVALNKSPSRRSEALLGLEFHDPKSREWRTTLDLIESGEERFFVWPARLSEQYAMGTEVDWDKLKPSTKTRFKRWLRKWWPVVLAAGLAAGVLSNSYVQRKGGWKSLLGGSADADDAQKTTYQSTAARTAPQDRDWTQSDVEQAIKDIVSKTRGIEIYRAFRDMFKRGGEDSEFVKAVLAELKRAAKEAGLEGE